MMQIASAFSIVESRCAITRVVQLLASSSESRALCTTCSDSVSNADVASSSSSTLGLRITARAIAKRCFCPPLIWHPRSPTSVL
mmetsp:Transcript_121356/g.271249  ORF Transcript_121356/g.271249 Transcript_121356/m.271249 type:complete len:84 (-) Transcript_121356:290-541(-)